MTKKVIGIIMIILGGFLALAFLAVLPQWFRIKWDTPEHIGNFIGFGIGQILLLTIILTLILFGLRFVRLARKSE